MPRLLEVPFVIIVLLVIVLEDELISMAWVTEGDDATIMLPVTLF